MFLFAAIILLSSVIGSYGIRIQIVIDGKQATRNIRYLLTLLLNESEDCEAALDEKEVGAAIDIRSFNYFYGKVLDALGFSLPDDDGDDDPNPTGGQ